MKFESLSGIASAMATGMASDLGISVGMRYRSPLIVNVCLERIHEI